MRKRSALYLSVAAVALAAVLTGAPAQLSAQRAPPAAAGINIGNTDLGGVVSGPNGPEAGVWVIAQTSDLPTKYAKIVVTDDRGRYAIPQLPKAKYSVWMRGYGLKDSERTAASPGDTVDIKAVAATPKEDAEHYP